jgi:hypothetical protein
VSVTRLALLISAGFLLSLFLPPIYAQEQKNMAKPAVDQESAQLIGTWEIARTKMPGKPYTTGYQGRPFVSKGANAFTLILEYRGNGTFRRLTRIGDNETVQEGTWKLAGHELRHKRNATREEEVMYLRFDSPDSYTSTEVFEESADPGLFAQFKRLP